LIEVVPELTWSSAINEGLDLLIQKLSAQLAQEQPQVFQSILTALSPGGIAKSIAPRSGH
jgi:hypothetical protein